jgi:NTE family protein
LFREWTKSGYTAFMNNYGATCAPGALALAPYAFAAASGTRVYDFSMTTRVSDLPGSRRIGLALSGGSVRGIAHIGVIKALEELGVRLAVVAGTSAGSLVGAMLAAGLGWREMAELARSVFWPGLLHGGRLVRFCEANLPLRFADLRLPFAAIATDVASKQAVTFASGRLAPALSASCAIRVVRRPVAHEGRRLKDGGIACVMPTLACRELGADLVIGSDVWELSSLLRSVGVDAAHPIRGRIYPAHYRAALARTDLLVQPSIPVAGYVPSPAAVDRLVAEGERAARETLARYLGASG